MLLAHIEPHKSRCLNIQKGGFYMGEYSKTQKVWVSLHKNRRNGRKTAAQLAIDRNEARQPQTDAADGKTDYGLHINTVEKRVGFSKNRRVGI
jgi:hypothetical protein